MDYVSEFYPESQFGGFTDADATIAFYTRVRALVRPSSRVLDLGCGVGHEQDRIDMHRRLRMLRGTCERVIGVDVDRAAETNPSLDEFRLIEDGRLPLEDCSVDLVLCDNVLEHVTDVDSFFLECRRVLVGQGILCLRTPNAWGYVSIASRLIPNRLHTKVLELAQPRRRTEEVFPTFYKCNTLASLRKMLAQYGFEGVAYGYESNPGYLHFSKTVYWLGTLYQKYAPKSVQNQIFLFARKKNDKVELSNRTSSPPTPCRT